MQLVIYLHALGEKGLARYQDMLSESLNEIVPAGVLYVPAHDELPNAERGTTKEALDNLRAKELRRSGLLTDDVDILEAMEHGLSGQAKYIPVTVKKPKKESEFPGFDKRSSIADLVKFGRLARYTQRKLLEMGQELRRGACAADPYKQGQKDICEWCDYRAACRFDESAGDKKRALRRVSDAEFWNNLETDEWDE